MTARECPATDVSPAEKIRRATDVLARTLYGEARGELVRGKEAVAAVIMNRVRRGRDRGGYWWGDTVEAVCLKPYQFSCWNRGDPNRAKVLSVTERNKTFASCLRIARRAVIGSLPDMTCGSTHYHTLAVRPTWAKGRAARKVVGRHLFYNNVE